MGDEKDCVSFDKNHDQELSKILTLEELEELNRQIKRQISLVEKSYGNL